MDETRSDGERDEAAMFVIVLGGGKIGANLARSLLAQGHEAIVVEQSESRYQQLQEEFEHAAILGDATELSTLEEAGIGRPPDIIVAATGDDEDNLVICQLAQETYGVKRVIARVNDPRNQQHFDLLGVKPTVSATRSILSLIEHEVPEHQILHLLELKGAGLEIVEVPIESHSPAAGGQVSDLDLPEGVRLISVIHNSGRGEIVNGQTSLHAGDQVLAILEPHYEEELRRRFRAPQQGSSEGSSESPSEGRWRGRGR